MSLLLLLAWLVCSLRFSAIICQVQSPPTSFEVFPKQPPSSTSVRWPQFRVPCLGGYIFLAALVVVGRLFLKFRSCAVPRQQSSVQVFLQSVRLGERLALKNAGGPHAAIRVLAGLTFLSAHLGLEFDLTFACPALVGSGDASPRRHENYQLLSRGLALAKYIFVNSGNDVFELFSLLVLVFFAAAVADRRKTY